MTAMGELLYCDKDQNSELYWAARGAGPGRELICDSCDRADQLKVSQRLLSPSTSSCGTHSLR